MSNEAPYVSSSKFELPKTGKGSGLVKWPFRQMQVGQFISVPNSQNWSTACACMAYACNRYGMKFKRKVVSGVLHIKRIA